MTTDQPSSTEESFDRETFETELAELVDHACEAGVTIKGGYEMDTPQPNQPDYTVEITHVTKPD